MVSFLSEFIVITMRKDNGKKVEMLERIIKRMSEKERREVNDRTNSSVTAKNGAYKQGDFFSKVSFVHTKYFFLKIQTISRELLQSSCIYFFFGKYLLSNSIRSTNWSQLILNFERFNIHRRSINMLRDTNHH